MELWVERGGGAGEGVVEGGGGINVPLLSHLGCWMSQKTAPLPPPLMQLITLGVRS